MNARRQAAGRQRVDALCPPIFLDQLEALKMQVEALKHKHPAGYARKNATKRLAAVAAAGMTHA